MHRVLFAAVCLVGLLFSVLAPQAEASSSATPSLHPAVVALLAAINADRARHGVGPLKLSKKQSSCSRSHSAHMASVGYLSHDQFPSDICVAYSHAGENVGVAPGDPVSAALLIHQTMMSEGPCPHKNCPGDEFDSHGHYLNLIDGHFKHVGIGMVLENGQLWLTENFTG